MLLRTGKPDVNVMDRSVRKCLETRGDEVRPHSSQETWTMTSDPVTLRTKHVGMLSVIAALNNLAGKGIRPDRIRTDILLPVGTKEERLRSIEGEIRNIAKKAQVVVEGGHTEVTAAVTREIVVTSAAGQKSYFSSKPQKRLLRDEAAKGKLSVMMIGQAGLEGTFLLSEEGKSDPGVHFSAGFLEKAGSVREKLLLLPALEAMASVKEEPLYLTNVSEGGIYAGLFRLYEETGLGFTISLPKIPILQETIEITEYYAINPYQMESAGCLLAVYRSGTQTVCRALKEQGIAAAVVGEMVSGRDKILVNGDEKQNLNRPLSDSLIPLLG